MRIRNILIASAAMTAIAVPAFAATTVTLLPTDQPLPVDQIMIEDFDNPIAAGFTFTQNVSL